MDLGLTEQSQTQIEMIEVKDNGLALIPEDPHNDDGSMELATSSKKAEDGARVQLSKKE